MDTEVQKGDFKPSCRAIYRRVFAVDSVGRKIKSKRFYPVLLPKRLMRCRVWAQTCRFSPKAFEASGSYQDQCPRD